VTFLKRFIL